MSIFAMRFNIHIINRCTGLAHSLKILRKNLETFDNRQRKLNNTSSLASRFPTSPQVTEDNGHF
jgi:hypothetical protein